MLYDAISFTSAGGRLKNEDSLLLLNDPGRFVAIVADGLGAHGGGEIASAAAVDAIRSTLPTNGLTDPAALSQCLSAANAAVLSRQKPGLSMKSTAVMLAIENKRAVFAHVGDSRGYMFHRDHIVSQTLDHSVSQLAVLRGNITPAQIRFHPSRSQLMRALGLDDDAHEEITPLASPLRGDAFLLCSDGFWEYVTEEEMEVDLKKSSKAKSWLSFMLTRIGNRIPEDHDNLTAIAVVCGGRAL